MARDALGRLYHLSFVDTRRCGMTFEDGVGLALVDLDMQDFKESGHLSHLFLFEYIPYPWVMSRHPFYRS